MKLGTIVVCFVLIVGLISVVSTPVLADGGHEVELTVSSNPLMLGVAVVSGLVVAYFIYRIVRGR